jgi:hypothetical protein
VGGRKEIQKKEEEKIAGSTLKPQGSVHTLMHRASKLLSPNMVE